MKCPYCKSKDIREFRALLEGLGHRAVYRVEDSGGVTKMFVCNACGGIYNERPKPKKEKDTVH